MSKNIYLSEVDKTLASLNERQREEKIPSKVAFQDSKVAAGHFIKVAFDVYKVENDPYNNLWILQDCDDGQFLVRTSDRHSGIETTGSWSAVSDYDKKNITLNYKNVPIARFSSKEFGFNNSDILTFKQALLEKVKEDELFIKDLLSSQPLSKKDALTTTFPEFKKFI